LKTRPRGIGAVAVGTACENSASTCTWKQGREHLAPGRAGTGAGCAILTESSAYKKDAIDLHGSIGPGVVSPVGLGGLYLGPAKAGP
jgi:hypothetical protein